MYHSHLNQKERNRTKGRGEKEEEEYIMCGVYWSLSGDVTLTITEVHYGYQS